MRASSEPDLTLERPFQRDLPARKALEEALAGEPIGDAAAVELISLPFDRVPALLAVASELRTRHKGHTVTFSPKVFFPVTNLCLDRCSYCTFRKDPDAPGAWTMLPEDVRRFAQRGREASCIEALMCLGDRPERGYKGYRRTLAVLGHSSTVDYLQQCCEIALEEGMIPHTNAGLLSRDDMIRLRPFNASLGLMLETISPRLRARGEAHQQAPDKDPALRLRMLREAGELRIPFTTGILLGIGETLAERVASLRAIERLHSEHGHIQEIIVQNFRAKPATRMAAHPEPESYDIARTVAVARLMMPEMNIQVPPNLNPCDHRLFLASGINDWGGISPVTLDFVNPEAPWPHLAALGETCAREGFRLARRLPVYAEFLDNPAFIDPAMQARLKSVTPAGAHHVDAYA